MSINELIDLDTPIRLLRKSKTPTQVIDVHSSPRILRSDTKKSKVLEGPSGVHKTQQKHVKTLHVKKTDTKKRKGDRKHEKKSPKKQKFNRKNFESLKVRTSPHQFWRCIHLLKPKQRDAVKRIGFGKLLDFGIDGIPMKLAYFVVNNFNTKTMQFCVGDKKITVDEDLVHQLLGIPKQGLEFQEVRCAKNNHDVVANRWKSLYHVDSVTAKDLVSRIALSNDDDSILFEIDFVFLFITTLVDCTKNGRTKAD